MTRTARIWLFSTLTVALLVLTSVAFVQSSQPVTQNAAATQADAQAGGCPYTSDGKAQKASGMPGSCSELHSQALAAGRMKQGDFDRAELAVAVMAAKEGELTPEQCRDIMAGMGFECNETNLKACAEKIQSLGFCKDMTADECAARLAKGLEAGDHAKCADAAAMKGCCLNMKTAGATKADAGTEVTPAVAADGAPKQCDWTKGNCGPEAKKTSDK